jgi:hypothetical protein
MILPPSGFCALILLPLMLFACADSSKTVTAEIVVPASVDTILLSDINLDGNADTAFVANESWKAMLNDEGDTSHTSGFADREYNNVVTLSSGFPGFTFENSIWGDVENAGDLDLDGTCELLFCTSWFSTTSQRLYLYRFHDDAWQQVGFVRIRGEEGESLRSHLVRKGKDMYLRGVKSVDGDEVIDEVKMVFNQEH